MRTSSSPMRRLPLAIALSALLALGACGGGGDGAAAPALGATGGPQPALGAAYAPPMTGNTATDAFNVIDFRRRQMGLPFVWRNASVDSAAVSHSDYQAINAVTTRTEVPQNPGYTGDDAFSRLQAAGYVLPQQDFATGEVVWSRPDADGSAAAQDLIGSIYDRFTIFEPMFKEAGVGAATGGGGATWSTVDLAAFGLDGGLPPGQVAVYPFGGQADVPSGVDSGDQPAAGIPSHTRTGYPVSVHANMTSTLTVQSFTLAPRGGQPMAVRLLTNGPDVRTPPSVAAIIPVSELSPGTTYDVQFTGAVDGLAVNRSWSFMTQ